MYKVYWLNTKKYCAGVSVRNGKVVGDETAPCYRWMIGKGFSSMLSYYKRKKYLITCKLLEEKNE
jgi:hypothetical protein